MVLVRTLIFQTLIHNISISVVNSSIDGLVLAFSRLLHQDIVVGISENQSDLKNQLYYLIFPVYERLLSQSDKGYNFRRF
jgi:hypothetical protein